MDYRWLLVLVLTGVGNLHPRVLGMAVAPPQDTAVSESEVVQEELEQRLAIPPGYRYEAGGRRDPFVNPVPAAFDSDTGPVILAERPLGLPGVLLNEAQLIGVVTSPEPSMNVVVVSAPGNRIFFARVGDELLDAVISRISSDAISFEVKPLPGSLETERVEEVVRRLSTTPGD